MGRIRTIKPEFRTSSSAAKISRDARLTFVLLLTEVDDDGRFVATPKYLAGSLFPHDDDVTQARLSKWMQELVNVDWVRLYEHDGVTYGVVPKFRQHQKVSHPSPSRLPPPPSGGIPESLPSNSGAPPEALGPDLGTGNRESSSSAPGGNEEEEEVRKEAQRRLRNRRGEALVDTAAWLRKTEAGIREERQEQRRAEIARLSALTCSSCGGSGLRETDAGYVRCDHDAKAAG